MQQNVDWVTERAKCSLGKVFEQLKAEVRRDVEIRENLHAQTPQHSQYAFSFSSSDRTFTVLLEGHNLHKTVEFSLEATAIVARSNGAILWAATVGLNLEGRCLLHIDNQDYEHWQARKMALDNIFFEVRSGPDFFDSFGGRKA